MRSTAGMANRQGDVRTHLTLWLGLAGLPCVLSEGHVISSVMRAGVAQCVLIPYVLFSLSINDMPSSLHHDNLALYADDTSNITTSRKPTLLVS